MTITRRTIQIANLQMMGMLDRPRRKETEAILKKLRALPPMNAAQIAEQRVSFVYGQLASTGITKDQVRSVLGVAEGYPPGTVQTPTAPLE